MGITMKADKIGGKRTTGLKQLPETPVVTSTTSKISSPKASKNVRTSSTPIEQSNNTTAAPNMSKNESSSAPSQPQIAASQQSQKMAQAQKVGALSLKNRIHAGRMRQKYEGESELTDLQYLVEEGPLSFRAVALLGGFFMILASILDLIDQDAADLTAMGELITVFLWIFGFIIIILEGRPFHIQIPFLYTFLIKFFGCFKYVWGRGFFYFVGGCLQFFLFTKYDMVSGIFFMILGIISIVCGYKASVKLAGLRNSISNRSDIKYLFHSFDKDRDGLLNADEFRDMMSTMDQNLDYNEFVAALSAIDVDNNGQISIQDMEQWYVEYSENDLPPGLSLCSKNTRYDQRARTDNVTTVQTPNAHLLA